MPRIAGVNIPENKHILFSLTSIFGIGRSLSEEILQNLKIEPLSKTKALTTDNIAALRSEVEKYKVEGDLRREGSGNIKRLKDINSYSGSRHTRRQPARGQKNKKN